jgi:hypothetical protein
VGRRFTPAASTAGGGLAEVVVWFDSFIKGSAQPKRPVT